MTTPSGQISLGNVHFEIYGTTNEARNTSNVHVHELANVAGTTISLNNMKSKTWSATHVPWNANGTYSAIGSDDEDAILNMTCNKTCTWSYVLTANNTSAISVSRANNSFANSISFTVFEPGSGSRYATWTITATAGKIIRTWNVEVRAYGPNGGSTCVTTDTHLPAFGLAGAVEVGDEILIGNPVTFDTRWGTVTHAEKSVSECVRITTESGIELKCSTTAPIANDAGEEVLSVDLLGHRIPVFDNGEFRTEDVVSVESVGQQEIIHITCENDFFLAGEHEGRYVFHHNMKPL